MATAETPPKRSIKRTVASTVEGRSPRFLLGSLAVAMVISLVAGLGIGFAVGGDDDGTTPAARNRPTTTNRRAANQSALATPPIKAVVVAALQSRLVVNRGQGRSQMVLTPSTRIEVVRPAKLADIKRGSRVLFALRPGGTTPTTSGATGATTKGTRPTATLAARAILIVSGAAKNRLGSTVAAVTPESMIFRSRGRMVTIFTTGAKVERTIPSTRGQLLRGRNVLIKSVVRVTPKKKGQKKATRRRVVTEVVALPGGSAFG